MKVGDITGFLSAIVYICKEVIEDVDLSNQLHVVCVNLLTDIWVNYFTFIKPLVVL